MLAAYYKALATCAFMKEELEKERLARQAMIMCFQKVYKSLELYKGHLINRIRFHLDRHHTEYTRYVVSKWLRVLTDPSFPTQKGARAQLQAREQAAQRASGHAFHQTVGAHYAALQRSRGAPGDHSPERPADRFAVQAPR